MKAEIKTVTSTDSGLPDASVHSFGQFDLSGALSPRAQSLCVSVKRLGPSDFRGRGDFKTIRSGEFGGSPSVNGAYRGCKDLLEKIGDLGADKSSTAQEFK
jgi:hypothetical protein